MKKIIAVLVLIIGLVFLNNPETSAQNVQEELRTLKKRIAELEKKMAVADQERREMNEVNKGLEEVKEAYEHLSIGGGITGIVQGTVNNDDNPPEFDNPIDGSYSYDLEIEANLEKWGTAFIHLEGGDGDNVADELANALTGVNADALGSGENEPEVVEAWWQFSLLDEMVACTIGKVDPVTLWDDNVVAKDEATQFMADIFVDQLAMEWPDYTPGFHVLISPHDLLDVRLGILSADNDWEDLFEDVFWAGEIGLKPKFGAYEGNYRLYGWMNSLDHVEWDDVRKGATVSRSAYHDDESNWGLGLSFDQQIMPDITLFCRFGYQNDDIAGESYNFFGGEELEPFAIEYAWSFGGQMTGDRWGRSNDVLGLAFGQAIISDDFEDVVRAGGGDPADEGHLEAYYSCYLNEYVAISPDIQVITNMGGDDDADTVTVFGVRCQLSF